jgi:transcriptional regulator with XRE-family HTH domain
MTDPKRWALEAVKGQHLVRELREKLPPEAADTAVKEIALARQRHETWEKHFGEVVRQWRLRREWTQEDVAESLRREGFEMHQTTVAKIERGARPLRVAEAAALADVFEMPIMAVFGLTVVEDPAALLNSRHAELDEARKRVDDNRATLYSVAQHHAYLLAEVEKLILQMNQHVTDEVSE